MNFTWPQLQKKPLSEIQHGFSVRIVIYTLQNSPKPEMKRTGTGRVGVVVSFIFLYNSAGLAKVPFNAPRGNGMSIVGRISGDSS